MNRARVVKHNTISAYYAEAGLKISSSKLSVKMSGVFQNGPDILKIDVRWPNFIYREYISYFKIVLTVNVEKYCIGSIH